MEGDRGAAQEKKGQEPYGRCIKVAAEIISIVLLRVCRSLLSGPFFGWASLSLVLLTVSHGL